MNKSIITASYSQIPKSAKNINYKNIFMLDDNFDNIEIPDNKYKRFFELPIKLDFTIVFICKKGEVHTRINLQDYEITKNDLFVVMPGAIADLFEMSNDAQIGIMIFEREAFAPLKDNNTTTWLYNTVIKNNASLHHIDDGNMKIFLDIYNLMRQITTSEFIRDKDTAIMNLINVLTCMKFPIKNEENLHNKSRNERIFSEFIKIVQQNYTQHRELSFYADKLCLTSKYMARIIKQFSGKSASDWIKDYVILEAKSLLKTGKYNVQQISEMLNFKNQSFFGKYFKEAVGVSPLKY